MKWVQLSVLLALMTGMFVAFVLDPWGWGLYKGLAHPKAMEQAQIGRELSRGNGFSTKMIRPLAYTQFMTNTGSVTTANFPDSYHAPLWPVILAPAFKIVKAWPESLVPFRLPSKDRLQMSTRDYIYVGDRMVSAVAILFFFLSIVLNYFTVRRLFDHTLGIWTVALMLGCNLFWRYSMSGLPQMLMLFFFSGALYALVRASEMHIEGRWPYLWLALVSLLFGLMALTHAITIWAFAGALFFCTCYFKPRLQTALLMAVVFLAVYSPWLARNYYTSGSPVGVSLYTALAGVKGSENMLMRSMDGDASGISFGTFRRKAQTNISEQLGVLFDSFGRGLAAPVFFLGLLHLFKNQMPRSFRWALFSMWIFSVIGMAVFGLDDDGGGGVHANDLNILFIPLFTAYGMAFILVLWSRLEITVRLVRYAFFALIFGVSSLALVNTLNMSTRSPVQWPPYAPPFIAIMRDWTTPEEIITSDVPWAVAWYADRKSLWLPSTIQSFLDLNDYQRMGGKIAGIYLTPFSGNKQLINEIVKGDYKEWSPFILRNVNIKDFPFKSVTSMPLEQQCIFYSDRDRWTERLE